LRPFFSSTKLRLLATACIHTALQEYVSKDLSNDVTLYISFFISLKYLFPFIFYLCGGKTYQPALVLGRYWPLVLGILIYEQCQVRKKGKIVLNQSLIYIDTPFLPLPPQFFCSPCLNSSKKENFSYVEQNIGEHLRPFFSSTKLRLLDTACIHTVLQEYVSTDLSNDVTLSYTIPSFS